MHIFVYMVIFARSLIRLYGSILVYMRDKRRNAYICLHRSVHRFVYVHLSVYMPILAYKGGYMGI